MPADRSVTPGDKPIGVQRTFAARAFARRMSFAWIAGLRDRLVIVPCLTVRPQLADLLVEE